MSGWKAIAAPLAGESRAGVYGVSLDSPDVARAYVEEHGVGFPVVTLTEPKTRALYHLLAVPQVLILDEQSRVVLARLAAVETDPATVSVLVAAEATGNP